MRVRELLWYIDKHMDSQQVAVVDEGVVKSILSALGSTCINSTVETPEVTQNR